MQLDIRLDLTSQLVRSRVLEGLDSWVRLGLLSDDQVRSLAAIMSEPVGEFVREPAAEPLEERFEYSAEADGLTEAGWPRYVPANETVPVTALENAQGQDAARRHENRLARSLRALLDEISVIWLLFLGVFLVVVSSGVLAASQWQSFSAVGQYAVLLAYTLVFWGASLWAKQQANLQSTARMLALTTLLLIPINFWMMDALDVLNTAIGLGVGGLSAVLLSCLPLRLLAHRSNQLNLVGMSWLHWGWALGAGSIGAAGMGLWPVAATYLGTIGTALNLAYQDRQSLQLEHRENGSEDSPEGNEASINSELFADSEASVGIEAGEDSVETEAANVSRLLSFDVLTVAVAVVILLFRSLFVVQVPAEQLGLAAGICGWLLVWLTRAKAGRQLWVWAGAGLFLVGWAVCVELMPPWQALGVSALALWLLWDGLRSHWTKESLLGLVGVSAQGYWLLGRLIPVSLKDAILGDISAQVSAQPIMGSEWFSLGFFPFLWGVLLFARQLRQWQKVSLAHMAESLSLAGGIVLVLLGLSNSFTLAMSLLLAVVTLSVVMIRRPMMQAGLMALAHGTGLLALAAWVDYGRPDLTVAGWAYVCFGLAMTELATHVILRVPLWKRQTWFAGIGLAGLSYYLLLLAGWYEHPVWLWLIVPVALTGVANHRRAILRKETVGVTMLAWVMQVVWMTHWPIAILSFALASVSMVLNTRLWRNYWVAMFAVGAGVACASSSVLYGLTEKVGVNDGWVWLFWVIEVGLLWLLQRVLLSRPAASLPTIRALETSPPEISSSEISALASRPAGSLPALFAKAAQTWGTGLMLLFLVAQTLLGSWVVMDPGAEYTSDISYAVASVVLLMAILAESIRYRPAEWRYWSLAWAVEALLFLGLGLRGVSTGGVAIATLSVGLLAQIAADIWVIRHPPYRGSWHAIPIAYGALGLWLGHLSGSLQTDTGLYTMFAAVIAMGVGRRQVSLNGLSYVGLAAFSIGAYELLFYQLAQASGGQPGDGLTLLAALALVIACLQKGLSRWLLRYLQLPKAGLLATAHAHWALGSVFGLLAALDGMSQPLGIALWTGTVALLAIYALATGNRHWSPEPQGLDHTGWTIVGIVQGALCIAYDRFVWFPDRTWLLTWGGVIACLVGFILYQAPWERWGWPLRPWRLLGLWLPVGTVLVTLQQVPTQSLLIVGAFYAWMAKQFDQIRLSYLSVLLFDWALLRYLNGQGWLTDLFVSLILGLSVLYFAEVEPALADISKKQQRHWLRMLASTLIGMTALYQAETYDPMLLYAAITLALCVGFIFAGLVMRVRAFLYVGTGVFVLQVIRILWLFISANSLLLWAVGIVLGLLFIWIAATFESRRSQVTSRLDSWTSALEHWD